MPSTKQCCDVLHDEVSGSKLANKSSHFAPQAGSFARESELEARCANVLAWESAAYNVHGNSVCAESVCGEGSNVVVTGNAGPVLGEYGAAVGFDFTEGDRAESGALKPEAKAADAAEQVEDIQAAPNATPLSDDATRFAVTVGSTKSFVTT